MDFLNTKSAVGCGDSRSSSSCSSLFSLSPDKAKSVEPLVESQFADAYIRHTTMQDAVHGCMEVYERRPIRPLIDNRYFQRLRRLKQNGTSYYVFVSASHQRFEHSLGVMHLAGKVMDRLHKEQPRLGITESEHFCVRAAALLHDLGHGPFSHVFEHGVMPALMKKKHRRAASALGLTLQQYRDELEIEHCAVAESRGISLADYRKEIGWRFRHEDMSCKLVDAMVADGKKNGKLDITDAETDLIKAIISPSTNKHIVKRYKDRKRQWLFQIVANDKCGVDVDRWDYLKRDSRSCKIEVHFEYERLLLHCRVVDGDLCYLDKVHFEISMLFTARYEMFKRVYMHKTTKAIEYMIADALKLADSVLRISERTQTCEGFATLDDHISTEIRNYPVHLLPNETDEDKKTKREMLRAQQLIERIEERNLYKCVAYTNLKAERAHKLLKDIEQRHIEGMSTKELLSESEPSICLGTAKTKTRMPMWGISADESPDAGVKINYGVAQELLRSEVFEIFKEKYPGLWCDGGEEQSDGQLKTCSCFDEGDEKKASASCHPIASTKTLAAAASDEKEEDFEEDTVKRVEIDSAELQTPQIQRSPSLVLGTIHGRKLHLEDIKMQLTSIHFGNEKKHPMSAVKVFNAATPNVASYFSPSQVSKMYDGAPHREIIFRGYTTDQKWTKHVRSAVMELLWSYRVLMKAEDRDIGRRVGMSPRTGQRIRSEEPVDGHFSDYVTPQKLEFEEDIPVHLKSDATLVEPSPLSSSLVADSPSKLTLPL